MVDYIQKIKNNSTPAVFFGAGTLGALVQNKILAENTKSTMMLH